MTDLFETGLLLDFYGKLLTNSQFACLDMYCNRDMSLAEIADEMNITRQGVHDFIKRGKELLKDYEDKLELVSRFMKTKNELGEVSSGLLMAYNTCDDEGVKNMIKSSMDKIDSMWARI